MSFLKLYFKSSTILCILQQHAHKQFLKRIYCTDTTKINSFCNRSHNCGELCSGNVGEKVRLMGWVQHQRMGYFLTLRDSYGVTQVIYNSEELADLMKDIPRESVLEVEGVVKCRPFGQENNNMATGDIEVKADKLNILNISKQNLPFLIQEKQKVNESLRLKYRYLDLRSEELQRTLRIRSKLVMKIREFLCNLHSFVEVETPTLFRKTPGGAREFVVPTHEKGKYYSLPQSPQQFKQLLMAGGIDRYMQIARCYRDEGARPDRQPEFTQVDLEMSFVTQDDIKKLIEELFSYAWPEDMGGSLSIPFPCMTYDEALTQYGVDKPDTRLEKIIDVTPLFKDSEFPPIKSKLISPNGNVRIVSIKNIGQHISNREIETLLESVKEKTSDDPWLTLLKTKASGNLSDSLQRKISPDIWSELIKTVGFEPTDVLLLASGNNHSASEVIAELRSEVFKLLKSKEILLPSISDKEFKFVWVEDFPLFLPKTDENVKISKGSISQLEKQISGVSLESAHHPFTAPKLGEEHLVYENPTQVRSQHYDLILNGYEIGGGSIRIYNSKLQRYILTHILKEETSELEHLLQALDSGCPPHGGIALGLDRILCILCYTPSIRDVIAFPKSSQGHDLMCGAPSEVSAEEINYYHLNNN